MDTDVIKRAEVSAAVLLSLFIFFLLIVRAQHAGGLWRDECTQMRLASLSTVEEVRDRFPFPLFLPAFLRVHTSLFGASDISIRIFGAGVGVALIGVAWLNARLTGSGPPLVLLSLIGLNANFLTWGTTIRGYGLGTVTIILAFGLAARLLIEPSRPGIIALFLALLAGPQFLIHDSPLVFAIAGAATLVCLVRGRMKMALILVAIATIIAATCLPYVLGNYQRRDWIVLKFYTSLAGMWMNLKEAFGPPTSVLTVVWCVLFLAAFGGAIWRLVATRRERLPESDLLWFAILVSAVSIAGYFAFLRVLNYWPHRWYFLPLLGTLAAAIELMIGGWLHVRWVRFARLGFAIAISALLAFAAWPKILERQTNIDLIARALEQDAEANDLVVVNPWDHGVSFNRYYHGSAQWVTVPMMSEHRIHRYDLLKAKMMFPYPLDDLFEVITQTLKLGHRVWLVGEVRFLKPGQIPYVLPPAPNSQFGWSNDAYRDSWTLQLGAFIQTHVAHANITPGAGIMVSDVENEPLWDLQGWRD